MLNVEQAGWELIIKTLRKRVPAVNLMDKSKVLEIVTRMSFITSVCTLCHDASPYGKCNASVIRMLSYIASRIEGFDGMRMRKGSRHLD